MKRKREKLFLLQIEKLDKVINRKTAEAQKWRRIATSLGFQQSGDRVQTSGPKDRLKIADRYIDIERDIAKLGMQQQAIIDIIESLPKIEYDVLYSVYVLKKEYQEIADENGVSYSWVTTYHGRGLEAVKRILDKTEDEIVKSILDEMEDEI